MQDQRITDLDKLDADSELDQDATPDEASVSDADTAGTESWRDKVARMAAEVAAREGCEIYDFDFIGNAGNRSLRVFIDKLTVDGVNAGVSIEDCSNVSRGLNLLLDVDDVIPGGAYNLEVSSPGLERPLRTAKHFERAVGRRAFVKTFEAFAEISRDLDDGARQKLGKSKQMEGMIVGIENGSLQNGSQQKDVESSTPLPLLVFDAENGGGVIRVKLPLAKVTKANTVFIFEANEKPSAGKKKKN